MCGGVGQAVGEPERSQRGMESARETHRAGRHDCKGAISDIERQEKAGGPQENMEGRLERREDERQLAGR